MRPAGHQLVLSWAPMSRYSSRKVELLPGQLQDLMQRSTFNLMEAQAERMRCLRTQYGDLFSQGDLDLDCTRLV